MYRQDRGRRGGGVCIILKDDIACTVMDGIKDVEAVCCKIDFGGTRVTVIGIYRPPASHVSYMNSINDFIAVHLRHSQNVIITGDFNLPGVDWTGFSVNNTERRSAQRLLDFSVLHGLTQLVHSPTRIVDGNSSILDLLFVSRGLVNSVCTVEHGISDHEILVFETKLDCSVRLVETRDIRVFKFCDAQDNEILLILEEYFERFQSQFLNNASADQLWHDFKKVIFHCLEYVPTRRKAIAKRNPWITRSVIHIQRQIARCRQRMKSACSIGLKLRLCRLNDKLKTEVGEARRHFFNITLPSFMKADPAKFWRYLSSKNKKEIKLCIDGTMIEDPFAVACNFNDYFHGVFTNESQNPILPHCLPSAIDDPTFPLEGILNLLVNVKAKKSCGPDNIPNEFLLRYSNWCAMFLQLVFQKSFETGVLPDEWKLSRVVPIYKAGDPYSPYNYRPVSLTCISCKLMEHILYKHISVYIEEHNILSTRQHGFRQGFSTVTQLTGFHYDLAKGMDDSIQTDVIFIDFAKAFDTIPHKKLLSKLYAILNNLKIIKWLQSYLSYRKQFVQIGNSHSGLLDVTSGVPQGSVLGPLLFNLYTNDIPDVSGFGVSLRLYADDTVLYRKISCVNDQLALSNALEQITKWCDTSQLRINVKKTVVMHVTKKHNVLLHHYSLNNNILARVSFYKYLGVFFQENLSWNMHVDHVCQKAMRRLFQLKRKLWDSTYDARLTAYKTLILPIIDYACIVWDPYLICHKKRLQSVQRKAARFICKDFRTTTSATALCHRMNLRPIEQHFKILRLRHFFHLFHSHSRSAYLVDDNVMSRHKHSLAVRTMLAHTDLFKFSFFPRTIEDWNGLPASIVAEQNINSFVLKLSSMLDASHFL